MAYMWSYMIIVRPRLLDRILRLKAAFACTLNSAASFLSSSVTSRGVPTDSGAEVAEVRRELAVEMGDAGGEEAEEEDIFGER